MEFRGRGDEIHVWPLSFKEFMTAYDGPKEDGWARLCSSIIRKLQRERADIHP